MGEEAADERVPTKLARSPSKRASSKIYDDDEASQARVRLNVTGTLGGSKEPSRRASSMQSDSMEPPPGRGYSRRKLLLQATVDPAIPELVNASFAPMLQYPY